jgi:hypothetical protein
LTTKKLIWNVIFKKKKIRITVWTFKKATNLC